MCTELGATALHELTTRSWPQKNNKNNNNACIGYRNLFKNKSIIRH